MASTQLEEEKYNIIQMRPHLLFCRISYYPLRPDFNNCKSHVGASEGP